MKTYKNIKTMKTYKNIKTMKTYKNIKTKKKYDLLLKSGMFWVCHPELTGDWQKDKIIIGGTKGGTKALTAIIVLFVLIMASCTAPKRLVCVEYKYVSPQGDTIVHVAKPSRIY